MLNRLSTIQIPIVMREESKLCGITNRFCYEKKKFEVNHMKLFEAVKTITPVLTLGNSDELSVIR